MVLRRAAVLCAGNWNPAVMENEELDLHARLRQQGYLVEGLPSVLVNHFTPGVSCLGRLLRLLNWRGMVGPRYGGLGMALTSSWNNGALVHLLSLNPEPFAAPVVIVAAMLFGLAGSWTITVAILAALSLWISCRRGVQYLAPSVLAWLQILPGIAQYRRMTRARTADSAILSGPSLRSAAR